jgi:hypothetical protein
MTETIFTDRTAPTALTDRTDRTCHGTTAPLPSRSGHAGRGRPPEPDLD